jgi:hypothetical protein
MSDKANLKDVSAQLELLTELLASAREYGLESEVTCDAILDAYRMGREQQSARVRSSDEDIIKHSILNASNEWIK